MSGAYTPEAKDDVGIRRDMQGTDSEMRNRGEILDKGPRNCPTLRTQARFGGFARPSHVMARDAIGQVECQGGLMA